MKLIKCPNFHFLMLWSRSWPDSVPLLHPVLWSLPLVVSLPTWLRMKGTKGGWAHPHLTHPFSRPSSDTRVHRVLCLTWTWPHSWTAWACYLVYTPGRGPGIGGGGGQTLQCCRIHPRSMKGPSRIYSHGLECPHTSFKGPFGAGLSREGQKKGTGCGLEVFICIFAFGALQIWAGLAHLPFLLYSSLDTKQPFFIRHSDKLH